MVHASALPLKMPWPDAYGPTAGHRCSLYRLPPGSGTPPDWMDLADRIGVGLGPPPGLLHSCGAEDAYFTAVADR